MSSQKVEQAWETPSLDEIPVISKQHVAGLEATDSDDVWVLAGMQHVIIRTIGRKSGQEHKIALPTWNDENGHRIVVASYAGAPGHPSWYLNLTDRLANPEVLCTVQRGKYWSNHEILDGADYGKNWKLLTADRAWYNDYQAKTDRRIPLIRLPETRPA